MEGRLPAHPLRKVLLMRPGVWLLLHLVIFASVGFSDEKPVLKTVPDVKPLDEVWEAAFVQAGGKYVKIGHVHFTSKIVEVDGKKALRTVKELRFEINRGGTAAEMKADASSDEDAAGAVTRLHAKMWLATDNVREITGIVQPGNTLELSIVGDKRDEKKFRWDPTCIGQAGEQNLLKTKKAKPGDTFAYRYFEPQITYYLTVNVAVKGEEEVTVPGGLKRKLLKAVATPEPLKLENGKSMQFPAATFWADPVGLDTVKTDMDLPGLGIITLLRTSKAAALAANGQAPDLFKSQSVYLKAAVPDMHERDAVTYRVTFSGDAQPKDLVSEDVRQAIKNINGKTFDLTVTARRTPPAKTAGNVDDQFLKSNRMITSDDAEVQKLATRAVGLTADPWQQAKKIESFVRNFMTAVDYTEAMAPADHVAKTGRGDCTEFAVLTAAMCRARGIPSRTAIGLVYVNNPQGKPFFGHHMWTEVFVNGEWMGLDATRGAVGAGHIKITDHSWAGVISLTPLLPVQGFLMAHPTIDVVK